MILAKKQQLQLPFIYLC